MLPSELRIGYEGCGQIDADDTSFWPALGHGEGEHNGATPHMEQLGFARQREAVPPWLSGGRYLHGHASTGASRAGNWKG